MNFPRGRNARVTIRHHGAIIFGPEFCRVAPPFGQKGAADYPARPTGYDDGAMPTDVIVFDVPRNRTPKMPDMAGPGYEFEITDSDQRNGFYSWCMQPAITEPTRQNLPIKYRCYVKKEKAD